MYCAEKYGNWRREFSRTCTSHICIFISVWLSTLCFPIFTCVCVCVCFVCSTVFACVCAHYSICMCVCVYVCVCVFALHYLHVCVWTLTAPEGLNSLKYSSLAALRHSGQNKCNYVSPLPLRWKNPISVWCHEHRRCVSRSPEFVWLLFGFFYFIPSSAFVSTAVHPRS
jgi:hypothetical protein